MIKYSWIYSESANGHKQARFTTWSTWNDVNTVSALQNAKYSWSTDLDNARLIPARAFKTALNSIGYNINIKLTHVLCFYSIFTHTCCAWG